MSNRRTPEDWRRAVFASPRIGDPVRVLLLYLADHMRQDRKVSIPRKRIATELGKSPRRIDERFARAREAGFLDVVSSGYRGHTAVYQGMFPSAERVTETSTLSSAETRTLSSGERVTPGGRTITTADLTATAHGRDVGSEERPRANRVRSGLTACQFHPWQPCPSDCRNYDDQRHTA